MGESLFYLLFYAVVITMTMVSDRLGRTSERGRVWSRVFEKGGFRPVAPARGSSSLAAASDDTMRVHVERTEPEAGGVRMRLVISPKGWLGGHVALWMGARGHPDSQVVPTTRVRTGDATFDATVFLSGPRDWWLAILDAPTRHEIQSIARDASLMVGNSEFSATFDDAYLITTRSALLASVVDLAKKMSGEVEIGTSLARSLREDGAAGFRREALLALSRVYPEFPGLHDILLEARHDPSPRVQLAAAQELKAEGVDQLLELATGEACDDASVAEAVASLGSQVPFERLQPVVMHALRKRKLLTARAAIERLALDPEARKLLEKILAVERDELAIAAATALASIGSPLSEPPLMVVLEESSLELGAAVVRALERLGTVAAVLPLRRFGERVTGDAELERAVDRAIAAIRSRAPGASEGQLALADAASGALSLAAGERGRLSLPADVAGRLSPSAPEPPSERSSP